MYRPAYDDYMTSTQYGSEHSSVHTYWDHYPEINTALSDGAQEKVVSAFADSPILNPDLHYGIDLHIDDGCMGGGADTDGDGYTGDEGTGGSIEYSERIYFMEEDGHSYPNFYYDYYSNNDYFASSRDHVFHYWMICYNCYAKNSAGDWTINRDGRGSYGGNYFVNCYANMDPVTKDLAQSFMHELGHNLGIAKTTSHHCNNDCAMQQSGSLTADYCDDCWSDINLADCLK